jgi:hypothetical protein
MCRDLGRVCCKNERDTQGPTTPKPKAVPRGRKGKNRRKNQLDESPDTATGDPLDQTNEGTGRTVELQSDQKDQHQGMEKELSDYPPLDVAQDLDRVDILTEIKG